MGHSLPLRSPCETFNGTFTPFDETLNPDVQKAGLQGAAGAGYAQKGCQQSFRPGTSSPVWQGCLRSPPALIGVGIGIGVDPVFGIFDLDTDPDADPDTDPECSALHLALICQTYVLVFTRSAHGLL